MQEQAYTRCDSGKFHICFEIRKVSHLSDTCIVPCMPYELPQIMPDTDIYLEFFAHCSIFTFIRTHFDLRMSLSVQEQACSCVIEEAFKSIWCFEAKDNL